MKRLATLLLTGLVLVGVGCRADAIDAMARTTALVDAQFAAAYTSAAADCLEASDTRRQYDECLAPWNATADAVLALYNTTKVLDVAYGRRAFRHSACAWFRALRVVDAVSPIELPAVKAGLQSKWERKC